MRTGLMLAIIFLPFIGGTFLQVISFPSKKAKEIYIFSYVLLNTILTYILLAQGTTDYTMLINFAGEKLNIALLKSFSNLLANTFSSFIF